MSTRPTILAERPEDTFSALIVTRTSWWDEAACRDRGGGLTALFFSEELQDIAQAKTICSTCPALVPCLEDAIERREPRGVWGGQLFLNGRILTAKRRRGRPPKNPRPEDQFPEIPIPEHLQTTAVLVARPA